MHCRILTYGNSLHLGLILQLLLITDKEQHQANANVHNLMIVLGQQIKWAYQDSAEIHSDNPFQQTGEVERLLEEANDLIEQIEVEGHATSGDSRKQVELFFTFF